MRHLKTFEKSPVVFSELKKYVICKNKEDNTYLALELIKLTELFYITVQTLTFSRRTGSVSKSAEISIKKHVILDRIIFQSDDINEIKNELEVLENIDKYNL